MFTHLDLLRLKQAQDILTTALEFPHIPEQLEYDLVMTLGSLEKLIDGVKIKQSIQSIQSIMEG